MDAALGQLRWQVDNTNDPLTAGVLAAAAGDRHTLELLAPHGHLSVLPLRLAGAAHRAALAGRAPDYARHLPTCGGDGDLELAAKAFLALVPELLDDLVPVQTNEPGRLDALGPAFAAVHERTGLPLRLLELGASAGLLLGWDAAPVVSRRGCDPNPLDPGDPADRLLLLGFVWAGQVERFRRLEAALDVAASAVPAPVVDRADAETWLAAQLGGRRPGRTTVVFHSITWQYLSPSTRQGIDLALASAARRADEEAPLAYVRFEPGDGVAETRVTIWPGGDSHLVAVSGFHGQDVDWRGLP